MLTTEDLGDIAIQNQEIYLEETPKLSTFSLINYVELIKGLTEIEVNAVSLPL
jgi:hypothetical protein